MELPILGVDAAFCGALVRSLMNGPIANTSNKRACCC